MDVCLRTPNKLALNKFRYFERGDQILKVLLRYTKQKLCYYAILVIFKLAEMLLQVCLLNTRKNYAGNTCSNKLDQIKIDCAF